MTIVDAVLDAIFPRTKREYERNLTAYEESKRTYEKTKQRYDEESKRYAEAMQAYRIRMNAWNHDMTQWNANVDLQGLTSQVRESIPDADSWSTEDSSSMLEGLLSIMENAIYTRPEPDSLPHLMFPALRDPVSSPNVLLICGPPWHRYAPITGGLRRSSDLISGSMSGWSHHDVTVIGNAPLSAKPVEQ